MCSLPSLPLPKDVPMDFRALPEYIVEDIVDYLLFAVQYVAFCLYTPIFSCSHIQKLA